MARNKPVISTKFALTRIDLSGLSYKSKIVIGSISKILAFPREAYGHKDPYNVADQLKVMHKALGKIKRHYRKELKAFKKAQKS